MNYFILDYNPCIAAEYHCDTHCHKMLLEDAQMLCTVGPEYGYVDTPYKPTHVNHPCSVWLREDFNHFAWAWLLGAYLSKEYTRRFGKVHKATAVINSFYNKRLRNHLRNIPSWDRFGIDHFALAMPDEYKTDCAVESYRNYYMGEKRKMAKWDRAGRVPEWWS